MLLLFVNAILNKLNYNRCIKPCQQQCDNISKTSIFCSAVRAKRSSGIQLGTACSAITLCRTIGFCGVIGGKLIAAARAESGKLINLAAAAGALNCAGQRHENLRGCIHTHLRHHRLDWRTNPRRTRWRNHPSRSSILRCCRCCR